MTDIIHKIMKKQREQELMEKGFFNKNFLRMQGGLNPLKIALMDHEAGICLTNNDITNQEKIQMIYDF